VGGRIYKMADLRSHLSASGLGDVETYIQSGNVRFRTSMRSPMKVEQHVEAVLGEHAGFDVPAVMLTPEELTEVYDDAKRIGPPPFGSAEGQRRYVIFFKRGDVPAQEAAELINAWQHPGEFAVASGRAVHVWLAHTLHEAKFFGALKKQIAAGTNRDLKVVTTLAERWGA
jgi:uncharacterized protein (DUF1697 family)